MRTWILLLRGINVGGANKVKMADLRAALTDAGFDAVASYIQSGNLVAGSNLDRAAVCNKVAAVIEAEFGFRPACLALTRHELENAMARNPFADEDDPKTVHLWFADGEPASAASNALTALAADSERWHLNAQVLYLHAPEGIARSKFAAAAERKLGVAATARNLRTVRQLLSMAESA